MPVRAIAIRISPPTPTRFKFICVLDPMTGVLIAGCSSWSYVFHPTTLGIETIV